MFRRAVVYASHYQFYVEDTPAQRAADELDDLPEPWTDEALQVHRIGVNPHSIAVGTARYDHVLTSFAVHPSAPGLHPNAEHVVEADLPVESGIVSLFGCLETPGPEHEIGVAPGRYRIRVSYVPSPPLPGDATNHSEDGDHFVYVVELYPASAEAGVVVLRPGPSPWAG